MAQRWIGKAVCCLMLMVFPISVFATDAQAAMLFVTGSVLLNGSGAPRNSALFPGDSIKTVKDSAATLTANGSTVLVDPSSAIVYRGSAVEISYGAALVTTKKGMAAKVNRLTVTPGSEATTYRVTRAAGRVLVAALHGSVAISDGSTKSVVNEGGSSNLPDPAPPQTGTDGGPLTSMPPGVAVAVGLGGALIGSIVAVAATGKPSSPAK